MHLLATETVTLDATAQAVDLEQSPADIVVLSFSDSDLSVVSRALAADAGVLPSVRLANLKRLGHPMSVDLYLDRVVRHARAVLVRCLGGLDYWRYGIEQISALARERGIVFAAVPGDDRPDPRLSALSTASPELVEHLDACFRCGGLRNVRQGLRALAAGAGAAVDWQRPEQLDSAVVLDADGEILAPSQWAARTTDGPSALVVFYRASLLADDVAPVMALMRAVAAEGIAPLALAVTSLKDPAIAPLVERLLSARRPAIILNTTAFSSLRSDDTGVLDAAGVPVLQVVLSGSTRDAWGSAQRGLSSSDVAMNVVLPELDGRILTRAISFKREAVRDPASQFAGTHHEPDGERVGFVARQAAAWVRLGRTAARERRIALMLSDYPQRGGRAGYAVGLDTVESVVEILATLKRAGYDTGARAIRAADVEDLLAGKTPDLKVPVACYRRELDSKPEALRAAVIAAWGEPEADPKYDGAAFTFPVLRAGNVTVMLQPDRGYAADRKSSYHDGTLPPRHAYAALYAHLRDELGIHAIVHLGTHGTLEWLPGKALALSAQCWPEAVLGPLPVIYPFIVNNPGEAAQAKRRLSAVTIGHLTPPLTAAGLHGALADLEGLIEEYAEADGVDPRRMRLLEEEVVARAWSSGLAAECGLVKGEPARSAITKLDAQLCDIKDLAVRDRLHVFGRAPETGAARDLATAIEKAMVRDGTVTAAPVAISSVLQRCGTLESEALLAALDGRRVAPGPSGAPSRGRIDVLPTGRNLTSIDPRAIPTRTAAIIGARAADEVVRRYLQDHGEYPRALVIDLWASPALRTGGDDLAQALAFLGCRPVWDHGSSRVIGVEVLPPAKLDRPRIDVTLRLSGLFRDLFETQIALFDLAVRQVAARDEDDDENPLAAARRAGASLARVYGTAPGTYGAGAAAAALDGAWNERADLGRAYLESTVGLTPAAADEASGDFRDRVKSADALVHTQDDRERDALDGDGVADFAGGFAAAARMLGNSPSLYHLDTSKPSAPKARTLGEEVARIVRGRLTNPRWLDAMTAHGHRGVAEIAQAVDALYAFSATADAVPGHLFDLAHERLIAEQDRFAAMSARNPAAAESIALRLQDALARGLWISRRNSTSIELDEALAIARTGHAYRPEAAQ